MSAVAIEITERDTSKDAHVALEAWARWARSALAIGWSSTSILARVIELGVRGAAQSSGIQNVEVDELCELVDRAVLRLDETQREVIVRAYLTSDAAPVVARKCGLTYGYYRNVLSDAIRRIGDYLAGAKDRMV